MKKVVIVMIVIVGIVFTFINCVQAQELQWKKYDLANYIGDFDDAELVDESDHLQVWYVYQYGDAYVVTIHNGELDTMVQLN